MNNISGIADSQVTQIDRSLDKPRAEIIFLKDHIPTAANSTGGYTSPSSEINRLNRIKSDLRDRSSFDVVRKKADSELLNEAYNTIVDALDDGISVVERSNLFDEWKDYLQQIISKVTNLNVNNRKILGSILVTVKGKDVADFNRQQLCILRESTFLLRQTRVTRNDSRKIIEQLISVGHDLVIPLSVDCISADEEARLENLMNDLLNNE